MTVLMLKNDSQKAKYAVKIVGLFRLKWIFVAENALRSNVDIFKN